MGFSDLKKLIVVIICGVLGFILISLIAQGNMQEAIAFTLVIVIVAVVFFFGIYRRFS